MFVTVEENSRGDKVGRISNFWMIKTADNRVYSGKASYIRNLWNSRFCFRLDKNGAQCGTDSSIQLG